MSGGDNTPAMVGLLTDFGWTHYVGQMKAVLWHHAPHTNIVDISHSIPKQDVTYAALELLHCIEAFPAGAWIIAVVDPGVGTQRPVMLAEVRGVNVVLPDNGLITLIARKHPVGRLMALTNKEFWRQRVSRTFDGRDIMASVVGQAIRKPDIVPLLGQTVASYQQLEVPEPESFPGRIVGHILYFDSFGNAITNVGRSLLLQTFSDLDLHEGDGAEGRDGAGPIRFKIDGITATPSLVVTYAAKQPGSFIALFGSSGYLEFALTNGNAARQVGLQRNQRFEILGRAAASVPPALHSR